MLSQTFTRAQVWGTDLGFPFTIDTPTYHGLAFLFGDTFRGPTHPSGEDSLAFTVDTNPNDCLHLSFQSVLGSFIPVAAPGIALDCFEVPTSGWSVNGVIYAFAWTNHNRLQGCADANAPQCYTRGKTVLLRSVDGGRSFSWLYDVPSSLFSDYAIASLVNTSDIPGLHEPPGQGVLVWGIRSYRRSNPFLGYVSMARIGDPHAWKFLRWIDPVSGVPEWGSDPGDLLDLFSRSPDSHGACLGEFSVTWNAPLRKWLMVYNCPFPHTTPRIPYDAIYMRIADQP